MSTNVFQDIPLIERSTRLTVIELVHSDKQIVNELVYRFCKLITRTPRNAAGHFAGPSDSAVQDNWRVLVLDMVGAINPVRLATVLKRDDRRLRLIGLARGCKINSTYVTLHSYLGRQTCLYSNSLKLVVIYHDEHFILKTLDLVKQLLQSTKCQVMLVVPRLDRQEKDILGLHSKYQILKCDFTVNRRAIGPAPPDHTSESYQSYLNQILITRFPTNKQLPDKVAGELKLTGLHLHHPNEYCKFVKDYDLGSISSIHTVKKLKSESQETEKEQT